MDRLFLDANVLFSAAYKAGSGVTQLWNMEHALLFSSGYAVDEAKRNLPTSDQRSRLEDMIASLELVPTMTIPASLREDINLPEKDWPIVGGALSAEATHLITGDVSHFGPYFYHRIRNILVLPPGSYIRDAHRTS